MKHNDTLLNHYVIENSSDSLFTFYAQFKPKQPKESLDLIRALRRSHTIIESKLLREHEDTQVGNGDIARSNAAKDNMKRLGFPAHDKRSRIWDRIHRAFNALCLRPIVIIPTYNLGGTLPK
jgi:hypothetical protein